MNIWRLAGNGKRILSDDEESLSYSMVSKKGDEDSDYSDSGIILEDCEGCNLEHCTMGVDSRVETGHTF